MQRLKTYSDFIILARYLNLYYQLYNSYFNEKVNFYHADTSTGSCFM